MNYTDFNLANKFEAMAGFALTKLQKQDVEQFVRWERSLNLYEVGGGKTVVSTTVSLMGNSDMTLVLMPPILLLGWENWLRKISKCVLRYQGTPSARKAMVFKDHRWVIMSHAIFRQDFERLSKELKNANVDIILDEAQVIKSPKSITYKYISEIAIGRRLQMLTGTPISKPLDCYAYIRLKTPEEYRSYAHFEAIHVAERDSFGSVTAYQNLDYLAERFAIQSIKRSKEEIHGYKNDPLFPDTSYELSAGHMRLYKRLMEEHLIVLSGDSMIDATTATRMYNAAQQIVVNFDHFAGDVTKRSTSYELINSVIEQTNCLEQSASKLIIWTVFKMTSRSILAYLKSLGIHAVGAYSEVDSTKNFVTFMSDPTCRIGVFQYQSAGAGLNPQSLCWESLHIETPVSPMLAVQSFGRLDRVGQKHKPTIRVAVAKGTIQEKLLERLLDKSDIVEVVERTKKGLRESLGLA